MSARNSQQPAVGSQQPAALLIPSYHEANWGIPPHPSVLMKALMDRSPKLARRDKRRVRKQQRRITIQQQAGQQQ